MLAMFAQPKPLDPMFCIFNSIKQLDGMYRQTVFHDDCRAVPTTLLDLVAYYNDSADMALKQKILVMLAAVTNRYFGGVPFSMRPEWKTFDAPVKRFIRAYNTFCDAKYYVLNAHEEDGRYFREELRGYSRADVELLGDIMQTIFMNVRKYVQHMASKVLDAQTMNGLYHSWY